MTDEEQLDWDRIRKLDRRVFEKGEPLELDDETLALLRRGARTVAIAPEDTEEALRGVSTATTLLREIRWRIRDGSIRASKAESQLDRLRQKADFAGARKTLEDALAVEVVPFYREQLESRLAHLATLEGIFLSGHIEPDFHAWEQLRVLGLRLQQGQRLELRDDLRAFLRRTAPTVAISAAEADAALQRVEGAEALLVKILERINGGEHRIKQALSRMMDCREAEDPEAGRQALRDVLAVEVVPQYRQMAEELLERYDEPPLSG
jgi:DUSAM domain-containing protein